MGLLHSLYLVSVGARLEEKHLSKKLMREVEEIERMADSFIPDEDVEDATEKDMIELARYEMRTYI